MVVGNQDQLPLFRKQRAAILAPSLSLSGDQGRLGEGAQAWESQTETSGPHPTLGDSPCAHVPKVLWSAYKPAET